MGRENTAKVMSRHGFTQFELTKRVLNNLSQFNLKPTAKLVLLYLCDCYNPKHGEMFPKQSTIAEKIGVSEVSVTRAIQELHKEGLLISERKYTNRYRFTSKIASEYPDNLIDDNNQKDRRESIKKTYSYIEQRKEQEKEQTDNRWDNVYSAEEYRILKDYAIKHNAKNINAYIAKLKQNGSDKTILKEYHKKSFITKRAQTNIAETQQLIVQSEQDSRTAESYENNSAWLEFGRKIGKRK